VADIGGGPGAYALWLAGLGYDVQHRDLVTAHVNHLQSLGIASIDTQVGDAGRLDLESGAVDAVLLLGPMYHLTGRDDRIATLREAARVSRPGGPIFIAAISRWAPRLDGGLTVWKACPSRSPILGSGSLTRSGGRSCSRLRPR
jgi:SAM-dependent methyltransferase